MDLTWSFRWLRKGGFKTLPYIFALLLALPVSAQEQSTYAWTAADLALINPAGWQAPLATADGDGLILTLSDGTSEIVLEVLPPEADDSALQAALETRLAS